MDVITFYWKPYSKTLLIFLIRKLLLLDLGLKTST